MNIRLVFSILFLFAYSIHGQSQFENEKKYFGGTLHYGLVDNNRIYLSMPSSSNDCFLWTKHLSSEKEPDIYDVGWTRSGGCWNKGNDMIFCIPVVMRCIYAVRESDFKNQKPIDNDTIIIEADDLYYYDMSIYPFSNYIRALDIDAFGLGKYYRPVMDLRKEIDRVVNIDMYSQNSDSMRFYMRDKSALYVYTLAIDTIIAINKYKPGVDKSWYNDRQKACWQEKVVYTSPDFDPEFPIYKYWKSYSGEKTQFNAITDSLFFEGNYKVIMQDDQTYLFNRKYGHIYLLTDTEVIRIGTIRLSNDYPAIKGHKYIIEDRDRGSILLFAPVDWHDDIHPKPTIEVVSEQEFYERYKLGE